MANNDKILLPDLTSLFNPRAEREITNVVIRIVDYFNNKLKLQQEEFDKKLKDTTDNFNKILEDPTSLVNLFATPVIGSSTTDPLLQNLIQNFGSQVANVVFASPNGASGNASFRLLVALDIPNLDSGKITTGVFGLDRIPTNVLKTDVALVENIVGAPNVNTGKTLIKDNNGSSINVMTCA